MNTRNMNEGELKTALYERAREEGVDLTDPKNRFTIWSENGIWCEKAAHLLHEGPAATIPEKQLKVGECARKTGYSRTMILDAFQDQIEIMLALGAVSAFGSR